MKELERKGRRNLSLLSFMAAIDCLRSENQEERSLAKQVVGRDGGAKVVKSCLRCGRAADGEQESRREGEMSGKTVVSTEEGVAVLAVFCLMYSNQGGEIFLPLLREPVLH